MGRTSPITYIVSYRCPGCGATLQARTVMADVWMRCPSCGKASQPPDHAVTEERNEPSAQVNGEVLVIGPDPGETPGVPPVGRPSRTLREPGSANPVRVAYAAGLFVTVAALVFAFLDQSLVTTGALSVVAAVLLVLLARPEPRHDSV